MYQLNVNSSDFTQRTKSVFDTLNTLEACHKDKLVDYVQEVTIETEDTELVKEAEFKVPDIPKRQLENDFKSNKKVKKTPDYVVNPQNWKKYSLEDVKDVTPGANYMAAMSFLNSKKMIIEEDEHEENIVFNKPIGSSKSKTVPNSYEDDFVEEVNQETQVNADNLFKKKKNRKFQQKVKESDDEESETKETVNSVEDVELNEVEEEQDVIENDVDVDIDNFLA